MARYLRSLTFNLALALLIIGCVLAVLHGPVAWVLVHGANVKSSFLRPASLLATLGVAVCAGITALAGVFFAGLDWQTALLLGAIVGSTDAAAVFALLTRSGVMLNERVASTLEIESGINDPMAVYLTLAFIAVIGADGSNPSLWAAMGMAFVQQFGWGGYCWALSAVF
jgi:NhaP-type Na+/H+ and K+/H+ antiporter